MHRGSEGDWQLNRVAPTSKLFGDYAEYRRVLAGMATRAPGSIVMTSSHGWSETVVLAGVRCRLPQTTVLVHQQAQASKIDMILLAASLKGKVLRMEKYMRGQCSPDQMELYERFSDTYSKDPESDFEQIQSHVV